MFTYIYLRGDSGLTSHRLRRPDPVAQPPQQPLQLLTSVFFVFLDRLVSYYMAVSWKYFFLFEIYSGKWKTGFYILQW